MLMHSKKRNQRGFKESQLCEEVGGGRLEQNYYRGKIKKLLFLLSLSFFFSFPLLGEG